jgi:hypothetical protein
MDTSTDIVNKVSNSGLITVDLEDFYAKGERVLFDIKDNLWQGLALKEQEFRNFLKEHDWSQYQNKNVAITCSVDAIVPTWAYMLLSSKLTPYAHKIVFGDLAQLENSLYEEILNNLDYEQYRDKKIVIKGCGKLSVPTNAYVQLASKLQGVSSSIMYGEPCSTVPIYKKPK